MEQDKKIASERTMKLFGMNAIIGTFNKHNPKTLYFDITLFVDGAASLESLELAKELLDGSLYAWVKSQDDYDRTNYIKIVRYPDVKMYSKMTKKTAKMHIDLSLTQKQVLEWKEAVKVAKEHMMELYQAIVEAIVCSGLELKDFKGYRSAEYKSGTDVEQG